jgi:hypothetical protein
MRKVGYIAFYRYIFGNPGSTVNSKDYFLFEQERDESSKQMRQLFFWKIIDKIL